MIAWEFGIKISSLISLSALTPGIPGYLLVDRGFGDASISSHMVDK